MQIKALVFSVGILILSSSCASKAPDLGPLDYKNSLEEDLVTVHLSKFIMVRQIDDTEVDWSKHFHKNQTIKVSPAMHAFYVTFNNGQFYSMYPITVTGFFQKGNTYLIKWTMKKETTGTAISFHLLLYNEGKEGQELVFNPVMPYESNENTLRNYLRYLSFPAISTSPRDPKSFKLENDNHLLIYKPYTYALTDKETGKTIEGNFEFSTNGRIIKIFMFENAGSGASRRSSTLHDYKNPVTILFPVECSETEVTYIYEKPFELLGRRVTFNITRM